MEASLGVQVDRAFSRLLEVVYDAALNPQRWPEAIAETTAWLGGTRALLFTPIAGLDDAGFFYSYGVSAAEMALWNSRYVGQDFWSARALERGLGYEGSIFRDSDLSTRQELLASDYYREHLTRMDIGWLLSGVILAPQDGSLPAVVLSTYRSAQATRGFDDAARERLGLLLPHLSRALAVMLKLRQAEHQVAASRAALDALGFGVLLLDRAGHIVHANRRAQALLHRADGLRRDASGQLAMGRSRDQSRWRGVLASSQCEAGPVTHFSEAMKIDRTCGRGGYLLQLSRLPHGGGPLGVWAGEARVICFLTESERAPEPDLGVLVRLYGLSGAEARTAQLLAQGMPLADAAATLHLSTNTLKTQLKQVYAKTQCGTRAELTRLMLSLGEAQAAPDCSA